MRKKDKKLLLWSLAISIFIAGLVLAVVLWQSRNKVKSKKLKDLVKEDLKYWKGVKETDLKGAQKLVEYWKLINWNFTVPQVQSESFQNKYFWSAIYISNLMNRWGAKDRFKYSSSHSTYIVAAKKAKNTKDKNAIFWGYRPNEVKVEIGDLVGKPRKQGLNYDNIYQGAPTHTDLVYDIEKTKDGYIAHSIGGNVSNTVTSSKIYLDKEHKITNPEKYLTVMKNQDV